MHFLWYIFSIMLKGLVILALWMACEEELLGQPNQSANQKMHDGKTGRASRDFPPKKINNSAFRQINPNPVVARYPGTQPSKGPTGGPIRTGGLSSSRFSRVA